MNVAKTISRAIEASGKKQIDISAYDLSPEMNDDNS